jgi:hypothetical protein
LISASTIPGFLVRSQPPTTDPFQCSQRSTTHRTRPNTWHTFHIHPLGVNSSGRWHRGLRGRLLTPAPDPCLLWLTAPRSLATPSYSPAPARRGFSGRIFQLPAAPIARLAAGLHTIPGLQPAAPRKVRAAVFRALWLAPRELARAKPQPQTSSRNLQKLRPLNPRSLDPGATSGGCRAEGHSCDAFSTRSLASTSVAVTIPVPQFTLLAARLCMQRLPPALLLGGHADSSCQGGGITKFYFFPLVV